MQTSDRASSVLRESEAAPAGEASPTDDDLVLLRGAEVARVLSVSRSRAYQMMSDGTLPVLRMGRAVRVPKRALTKWVEANTRAGVEGRKR
jgi:excisionase family DNA binding protein